MQFRKLALVVTLGLAIAAFFAFDLGQYLNLQTLKDQWARITPEFFRGYLFKPGFFAK